MSKTHLKELNPGSRRLHFTDSRQMGLSRFFIDNTEVSLSPLCSEWPWNAVLINVFFGNRINYRFSARPAFPLKKRAPCRSICEAKGRVSYEYIRAIKRSANTLAAPLETGRRTAFVFRFSASSNPKCCLLSRKVTSISHRRENHNRIIDA